MKKTFLEEPLFDILVDFCFGSTQEKKEYLKKEEAKKSVIDRARSTNGTFFPSQCFKKERLPLIWITEDEERDEMDYFFTALHEVTHYWQYLRKVNYYQFHKSNEVEARVLTFLQACAYRGIKKFLEK